MTRATATKGPGARYDRLREIIGRHDRVAVACSGGVDSTLVLRAALDALGADRVMALVAVSPLQPEEETGHALDIIAAMGSRYRTVSWDPLAVPEIAANPPERCYLCKKGIYTLFQKELGAHSFSALLDGSNLDDLEEVRPGRRALQELGVETPLVEAGLGKAEIREMSRKLGLATWNRPSASCLATRIPTGSRLTMEKINLVARCENCLHRLGYPGCRVRTQEDGAVVELAAGDLIRFVSGPDRTSVRNFFAELGITRVSVDLRERKTR